MSFSNAVEKHILTQQRVKINNNWFWELMIYYPSKGEVIRVVAPENKKTVVLNDAL